MGAVDVTGMDQLRALLDSGEFHHATYRCIGSVWEGLWCYRKSAEGFRGYEVALSFPKGTEAPAQALLVSMGIGTHVGAYGGG